MLKQKIEKAYNWCYEQIEINDFDYNFTENIEEIKERAKEMLVIAVDNIPQDFELINSNLSNNNYDKMVNIIKKYIEDEI